jgi:hypothetical protein
MAYKEGRGREGSGHSITTYVYVVCSEESVPNGMACMRRASPRYEDIGQSVKRRCTSEFRTTHWCMV